MTKCIVAGAAAEIAFGMARVVLDRLRKTSNGVAEPLKLFIRISQIMPCADIFSVMLQTFLVRFDRLAEFAKIGVSITSIIPCRTKVILDGKRHLITRDRLVEHPHSVIDD